MKKTIAIDLDDTLNNFTETLQKSIFVRDETFAISEKVFHEYLDKMRSGAEDSSELLSTEYSFFKAKIQNQCFQLAEARPDGIAFMQWLRSENWRIVICTHRDLRRANECTRKWLGDHDIPFDHLFMAGNKIVFCKLWGIENLVDDDLFNIVYGEHYGINVYYPLMDKHLAVEGSRAKGFKTFDEVKTWIQG